MICLCCGTEMEKGWLLATPPILWSPNPTTAHALRLTDVVTPKGDLRLPRDETGRTPVWNCPKCRKLIADY